MAEKFNAPQAVDFSPILWLALGLIVTGVVIEVILRLLRRGAKSGQWQGIEMIFNALLWRPLLWCALVGVWLPFVNLANNAIVRDSIRILSIRSLVIFTTGHFLPDEEKWDINDLIDAKSMDIYKW